MADLFDALDAVADAVWETSASKGFKDRPVPVSEQCANIAGEVSELWEAFRRDQLGSPCDKAVAMAAAGLEPLTCLEEEMADVIIRALDAARDHGLNVAKIVRVKNAYNRTRERMHGKVA